MSSIEGQLNYPVDYRTRRIIERVVDGFLAEKIFDILWTQVFYYVSTFENIDTTGTGIASWALTKTGTAVPDATLTNNRVTLSTGTTSGNRARLIKTPDVASAKRFLNFQKRQRMRTQIKHELTVANLTAFALAGDLGGNAYGFRCINGALVGVVVNNAGTVTATPTLTTMTADTDVLIEARYVPGQQVTFYINGDEKGILTTGLPTENVNPGLAYYRIQTDDTTSKSMTFSFFEFIQEL